MTDPSTEILLNALPGLEFAVREAVARSMAPEQPLALRLQFYRAVCGLARSVCRYREAAGLPAALPMELILLLGRLRADAGRRLYDPDLPDEMVAPLIDGVERLMQAVLSAIAPRYKPIGRSR